MRSDQRRAAKKNIAAKLLGNLEVLGVGLSGERSIVVNVKKELDADLVRNLKEIAKPFFVEFKKTSPAKKQ